MKNPSMKKTIKILTLSLLLAGPAGARDIHVTPAGSASGDGSKAKPSDLSTALDAKTSSAKPGDRILLAPGLYEGRMEGIKRIPWEVTVSGAPGQPILVQPEPGTPSNAAPHLNGCIHLGASHLQLIGLEIGDLQWDPYREKHDCPTILWADAGTGSKLINCNLFGGEMGSGIWKGAVDFELYGTLIHDFGSLDRKGGRGSGHAVYTQNVEGKKTYLHNQFYRGCGWNFDIYTQQGGVSGFDVIENISFLGGWYKTGQNSFSFGLAGWQSADAVRFLGNIAYQPRDNETFRANARMIVHKKSDIIHKTGVFNDNYVMGAFRAFSASRWDNLTVEGNTFWATGILFDLAAAPGGSGIDDASLAKPDLAHYHIDKNTYISNGKEEAFRYGGGVEATQPGELLTFAQWQKLGLDAHSTLLPGKNGRPTGTKIFVFPNTHDKGRAHVAIFNWDGRDTVEVDLAPAVAKGQKFRVYNVLDIKQTIAASQPVVTGVYDGQPLALPMRKDKDCPDFDSFLVLGEPAP
jgi:hypothetical protein